MSNDKNTSGRDANPAKEERGIAGSVKEGLVVLPVSTAPAYDPIASHEGLPTGPNATPTNETPATQTPPPDSE